MTKNEKHQIIKKLVLDLYQSKYYGCNLTHYQELLAEMKNINLSISAISAILRKEHILSPKAHRVTKAHLHIAVDNSHRYPRWCLV